MKSFAPISRRLSASGSKMSQAHVHTLVADLKHATWRARDIVAETSHLNISPVPVKVVDRSRWIAGMSQSVRALLKRSGTEITLSNTQIKTIGFMVARRVLGHWDPYADQPKMYLIGPNIARFICEYNLNQKDMALWVVIHEYTHAAQFATAPWLADYIGDLIRRVLTIQSANIDTVIGQITAVMSLLEGHATYVSDLAYAYMSSPDHLAHAVKSSSRNNGALARALKNILGISAKEQQYRQGRAFVGAVVDAVGIDGLNKVWEDVHNVPTVNELHEPHLWVTRVHGEPGKEL
ncbi:zinc-dependent metalloprotease [Arcanobacterium pinnipediorum]|uniref:Zinc-dependent metalloprotease n=1 Tax=Arcanobacterium pinnipediorum TaxID=1503041 RepID=A0ABY5AHP0_9ACTO|nr:zinc-dependent metalloprotease [Arcanobacterium pinnipediorum]USR79612.1 zinc-dependent metalloprotease [Arcanobacterium pinnipediorum]